MKTAYLQRYVKARERMRKRRETLRAQLPATTEELYQHYRAEVNTAAYRRLYRDLEAIGATQAKRGRWELPQAK